MKYGIRFDFPELDDPLFAGWTNDHALAFAPTLQSAAFWDSEEVAQRFLANGYGSVSKFGTVFEVGE